MSISSSLAAGVTGLNSNATRLAAISDNIANASTPGYRRVVTEFSSLVIQSGGGTYSAGGVRAASSRLIDQGGPLLATSNATDLAVGGRGFLPVTPITGVIAAPNGPADMLLTTTGSFRPDDEGYLRTEAGLVLMGWPTNTDGTVPNYPRDTSDGLRPIQVNINQFAGDPTTRVSLGANLPATSTEAGSTAGSESLSTEYFSNLGVSETLTISFTPTVPPNPGDAPTNEWTMEFIDSASGGATVAEYTITFSDARLDGGTLQQVATVTGGDYDPETGYLTIDVDGGPLDVDIGLLGRPDGLTQLSNGFAPVSVDKNGSPAGVLQTVELDENGFVYGIYDAGFTRTIYQVPLVDFPNINALTVLSNQTYRPSIDSGPFYLWDAGDGPTGEVLSFTREESATDVAAELTQLIQTQRAYSSNAKVIQTVDEMLQETTNIIR